MNRMYRSLCLAALLLVGFSASAQLKIGYTNLELILAVMPETKVANQELQTFEKKLSEKLEVKTSYFYSKQEDYQAKAQRNQFATPQDRQAAEDELRKLQQEIRDAAAEADQQVQAKRQQLYAPILEKLQAAIEEVAKANGYTYILNIGSSGGASNILFGPEEDNITEKLLDHLGIELPEDAGETTATGTDGN